ncbi:hypothetical protein [Vibrio mexicanus]|uniref:hypothetical protein n=1 Tax=Vibrio mexicanus TaxID=1004326 RepID=UPI000699F3F2|nr:hypothetical protein [Vibrio mexicanus]
MISCNKTIITSLLVGVIAGCGSDSSSTTATTGSESGVFVDAAVANVNYRTETVSGVTDSEGKYTYNLGETVTFSIGSIEFPPVPASGVVTPLDLAGTNDTEDDQVINIIRLLQTLDTDGDPSNGITISDDAKDAATTDIDFDVDKASFAANQTVLSLISQGGQDSSVTELVSESAALAHFESTLSSVGVTFGKFVGTWLVSGTNENELLMFTFFADGTYVHAEIDTDPQNAENPDEISGMEWGKYSVNDLGEFYSDTTYFDQNGDTGLTDIIRTSDINSRDGGVLKFTFNSDATVLTFNITEYESGSQTDTSTLTFNKLTGTGIIGTWLITGENENELLMFTFLNDGTYVHAEVDTDLSTATNPNENNGLEWGNYSLNAQTNELTVSFDNQNLTDLNGDVGLSDAVTNVITQMFATVNGDVLQLRVLEASSEQNLTFLRQ